MNRHEAIGYFRDKVAIATMEFERKTYGSKAWNQCREQLDAYKAALSALRICAALDDIMQQEASR